ncbi:TorD/DmsD family molecular chaperone [Candidatus Thiodiazotropha sp. CDECU1]|uniref:TorD/DmsD family molecular chaperone n=1 Tax=Candidatus Thiodiazotropha sp. CDECU1 TaxID=3065865 RepID=UPI00292CF154|nr:molecular chaperone TorD family protein [Candidatus Thiodiazotropha sp. CDECU1]
MGIDRKDLVDSARSRSDIYGLLSTVFRREPSQDLIKRMRSDSLLGTFTGLGVELGERFYNDRESEVVEELAIEYARLFIGPGQHISAHESIFNEADGEMGGLWGVKTVEVKKFIQATGLEYGKNFTGLPDHISVELEFMQKLTEWEADKWLQEDRESAEQCQLVQHKFLEQHLLCWVNSFCDAVLDQAEIPFYRVMAELTKQYMEFERQSIATDTAA